ncbi:PREDICTED: acyl-lipid (8-3)-desaturase-like isoform X1 [Acropora digitifera]|uniref:acyl-lipid (8-3)-desaturase-like isoform X1 n=1 Tax=Acropora digitifera TaxID=70779 RepID=UPI00077A1B0A|nr:PREDICTED: acyl-lipid (8-3)-desaturase-like isoform X1 [Acropora digitifera]
MSTNRKFTWEELSSLNQKHNAHVAVRGKVYDVSQFLSRHPGGSEILIMAAGKDVTIPFECYHTFSDIAFKTLDKYYVGDLISNEFPTFPELGSFYTTTRDRVQKYFERTNQDPKNSPWIWLRHITMPVMIAFLWLAQMFWLRDSIFLSCVAAVFMGWFSALSAMVNHHDASHFSVTRSPVMWRVVGHLQDFVNGTSYYVWVYQHIFGHHPYTNIDGFDPDISTAKHKPDMRRIKWSQSWVPRYFYQHIYIPSIYCLIGLKTRFQDIATFFIYKSNSTITLNEPSTSHLIVFVSGKIVFVLHKIVIPLIILGFWRMVTLTVIADIVGSYWLALIFQASHVVSEVEWPQPGKDGKMNRDWAELQVETTQDYATDSWFFNVFTGALNHQTAHHLFPGVSQIYYPQITPIVRQACKEFGVRYNYKDTFTEALGAHIGHLKTLGQQQEKSARIKRED